MTPTLHLNGTSRGELLAAWEDAYRALDAAKEALSAAMPNARDYYPQGSDAWSQAKREHDARIRSVMTAQQEIMTIVEGIYEQIDAGQGRP